MLLKSELKYNLIPFFTGNLIILLITYFIFGFENLDDKVFAIITERLLPLGLILAFVTLYHPEERKPLKDLIVIRKTSIEKIYIIRIILRLFLFTTTTLIYLILIKEKSPLGQLSLIYLHCLSIGMVLGVPGLLVFSMTSNLSLSFLTSAALTLTQWFLPRNLDNVLLLFRYPHLNSDRILFILCISMAAFIFSLYLWKRKRLQ